MIGEKMQAAFNDQINAETYSAYLYWSMAEYFESEDLGGLAAWMRCQAQEEMAHAAKFDHFVNERGGRVVLKAIDEPPAEWDSPLAAFEAAYAHEQKVTALIDALVKLARKEDDTASEIFLQWFVSEQVEEEAAADGIVQKLKRLADAPGGLLMLDEHLGQRTFAPASKGEES